MPEKIDTVAITNPIVAAQVLTAIYTRQVLAQLRGEQLSEENLTGTVLREWAAIMEVLDGAPRKAI